VKFEIGGGDPKTPNNEQDEAQEQTWECVWKCHTATPVHHMAFSPDGTLFATSGKSDRLVKVWYENKHCKLNEIHNDDGSNMLMYSNFKLCFSTFSNQIP
jgi:WD40 repeat protein